MNELASGPAKPKKQFTLHTLADLEALPRPEWLIEGIAQTRGLTVLYGPSNAGKSFAALDWALSVATGKSWHDRKTSTGRVAYVVGEGATGIVARGQAWMKTRAVSEVKDAFFILTVPQFMEAQDVDGLTVALDEVDKKPSFIVIDTLARCFVGGDENSAKDMGTFVQACRDLQSRLDAAILLVHHTGKDNGKERGSSALRGAADVMIGVSKKGDVVTLTNDKQKDDREFEPVRLRLTVVKLEGSAGNGEGSSCVLEPMKNDPTSSDGQQPSAAQLNQSQRWALEALAELDSPVSSKHWHGLLNTNDLKPVPDKTFQNWKKSLIGKGLVETVSLSAHTYQLTDAGHKALGHGTPVGVVKS